MKTTFFAIFLILRHLSIMAQGDDNTFTIKGVIDNYKDDKILVYIWDRFDTFPTRHYLNVDASGGFAGTFPLYENTDISIVDERDHTEVRLFAKNGETIDIRINAEDFIKSAVILNSTDTLNIFQSKFYSEFKEYWNADIQRSYDDTCHTVTSLVKMVYFQFNQQNNYMYKYKISLDSTVFDKLANEIYYHAVYRIVASKIFKKSNLSYFTEGLGIFPYLVMKDTQYYRLWDKNWPILKKLNPHADSSQLNDATYVATMSEAANKYQKLINMFALQNSKEFRIFLFHHYSNLYTFIWNRQLGLSPFDTEKLSTFLKSLVKEPDAVDMLIAGNLQNQFHVDYGSEDGYEKLKRDAAWINNPIIRDRVLLSYRLNFKKLNKGMPAPNFILDSDTGKKVSLDGLRGKYVILNFWGSGCGPCILDMKLNASLLNNLPSNVILASICLDKSRDTWKRSIERFSVPGTNLIVNNGMKSQVIMDYNVSTIPRHVIIDPNGNVLEEHGGNFSTVLALVNDINRHNK